MKYTHIIFDIDGTLLDTEEAVLKSLHETLKQLTGSSPEANDLKMALGIPGRDALERLGITDITAALELWSANFANHFESINIFKGIKDTLDQLKSRGFQLGIVTSQIRQEFSETFLPHGIASYFDTVICSDDTILHKPNADPLLKYLEITQVAAGNAIYIGDSVYDMQCAAAAGVTSGLALWGCASSQHINADHYIATPQDILPLAADDPRLKERQPWLDWAMELQFIAQAGLTYSHDMFDLERFERIRELSVEILSMKSGFNREQISDIFCNEQGFQTPKLDTRAAIFQNEKILLVKEKTGVWSLPGGWVDVNQSIRSNTIKEVKEEAGLDVIATKLIAVQDRKAHNLPVYAYGVCKVFVLCEVIGGVFQENIETTESSYFSMEELPALAEEKNNSEQIQLCFNAWYTYQKSKKTDQETWTVPFD